MDRAEAEILAMLMIEQHKRDLYMARRNPNLRRMLKVDTIRCRYPIGSSTLDDGTQVFATKLEAILIRNDVVVGREDNAIVDFLDVTQTFDPNTKGRKSGEKLKYVDNDRGILEEYLRYRGHALDSAHAGEARTTWDLFKAFTNGKLIKDCTRADGRAYAAHLRGQGAKTATIMKKISYLAAPINHATETGDLSANPFFRVIDQIDDKLERLGFDDNDMKLMRDHALPKLDRDERLMWLILATTGMRHSEAFLIREEFAESGIRYVRVGKKSDSSKRMVPLPEVLIPHLPARIHGPLFADPSLKNISKNLSRAMRRVGITDKRKVVYSTRHRAHTRLREVECDGDMQRQIVGHETGEAHVQYGKFPMRLLKKWIDQIGY